MRCGRGRREMVAGDLFQCWDDTKGLCLGEVSEGDCLQAVHLVFWLQWPVDEQEVPAGIGD